MGTHPKIMEVHPCGSLKLLIRFDNGVLKEYDCAPLLSRSGFRLLSDPGFFKSVSRDIGGYGISWNDDIDLSEYELWHNGKQIGQPVTIDRHKVGETGI